MAEDPLNVIERLMVATNAHDLDAIVGCFSSDYVNETPVHPARSFTGVEQVRRNWTGILSGVRDVQIELLAVAVAGQTVWTEQEHRGRRPDGSPHVLRGVVIFTISDGLISKARFYLEPLDTGAETVDAVLRRQLGSEAER